MNVIGLTPAVNDEQRRENFEATLVAIYKEFRAPGSDDAQRELVSIRCPIDKARVNYYCGCLVYNVGFQYGIVQGWRFGNNCCEAVFLPIQKALSLCQDFNSHSSHFNASTEAYLQLKGPSSGKEHLFPVKPGKYEQLQDCFAQTLTAWINNGLPEDGIPMTFIETYAFSQDTRLDEKNQRVPVEHRVAFPRPTYDCPLPPKRLVQFYLSQMTAGAHASESTRVASEGADLSLILTAQQALTVDANFWSDPSEHPESFTDIATLHHLSTAWTVPADPFSALTSISLMSQPPVSPGTDSYRPNRTLMEPPPSWSMPPPPAPSTSSQTSTKATPPLTRSTAAGKNIGVGGVTKRRPGRKNHPKSTSSANTTGRTT